MMSRHILITGGAGFIGSHLADDLLQHGYRVRVLDNLCAQVHGPDRERPEYLDDDVELHVGDVRDPQAVRRALNGIDAVFHLAAAVGVGQSMYEIAHYTAVNNLGTAVLMEALAENPVERLVVASSMSIYGEGLYQDPHGNLSPPLERSIEQLRNRKWEVRNNRGEVLSPVATPETKPPSLASIYALSKYDQERMCLITGRAYNISTVALRFFNVYGPRQALSNPYTGVLAIFASRLLNDHRPLVFEDGKQRRDFVSVHDVATACRLAMETPLSHRACPELVEGEGMREGGRFDGRAFPPSPSLSPKGERGYVAGRVINVGSGESYSVLEIAQRVSRALGRDRIEPEITGKYRVGDIRHCFSDIRLARRLLKYEPQVRLEDGLVELAEWLEGRMADDRASEARAELDARGLAI